MYQSVAYVICVLLLASSGGSSGSCFLKTFSVGAIFPAASLWRCWGSSKMGCPGEAAGCHACCHGSVTVLLDFKPFIQLYLFVNFVRTSNCLHSNTRQGCSAQGASNSNPGAILTSHGQPSSSCLTLPSTSPTFILEKLRISYAKHIHNIYMCTPL